MSSRSLRSVPSGLEENAVADRKVRSRRRRADRIGLAQRLRGRGRAGLRGQGSGWLGGSARGLGVPGASLRHPSVDGPHRGTQVTRRTRVGQYARLWWESQGTSEDRRGVLDVGRVR